LEAKKQQVLYFDFELSPKQFEVRYSIKNEHTKTFENHYSFDSNFKRIEINPDAEPPTESSFEDYLNHRLSRNELKLINGHLKNCPLCRNSIDAFIKKPDIKSDYRRTIHRIDFRIKHQLREGTLFHRHSERTPPNSSLVIFFILVIVIVFLLFIYRILLN